MTKSVRVVPYDPAWPDLFASERDALSSVFGDVATAIHHIGSTSVPGLSAKPALDILVEARGLGPVDALAPSLVSRGYDARGAYGIPGRRYFSRPAGAGPKVHLHVFAEGDEHAVRHLLFRDFLRAHPRYATRYGELKTRLAREHSEDRDAYQDAKDAFVEELLGMAAAWRRGVVP